VERTASRVVIHAIRLGAATGDSFEIEVRCSQGTYIRALARDLGSALGVGGHLVSLRRTRSGEFGLGEAVAWDELARAARDRLIPRARLLSHFPAVTVTPEGRHALGHGQAILPRHLVAAHAFPEGQRVRIQDPEGDLLALAVSAENGALRPDVVFLESP
jgi:tRNA pseudouridine55 synthase